LEDKSLLQLLQYILACGNYMNGINKHRGGAFGFDLNSLQKVNRLRSN